MWNEPVYRTLHEDAAAVGDGNIISLHGKHTTAVVQITGDMGVITFKGSVDGVNWSDLASTPYASGTVGTTAAAVGIYAVPVLGLRKFKAEITTHTGGTDRISADACFVSEDVSL